MKAEILRVNEWSESEKIDGKRFRAKRMRAKRSREKPFNSEMFVLSAQRLSSRAKKG